MFECCVHGVLTKERGHFLVLRTIFSQNVQLEFVGRGSLLTDNRRVMEELIERNIYDINFTFFNLIVRSWIIFKKLYQLLSYMLYQFHRFIVTISFLYDTQTKLSVIYLLNTALLLSQNFQHLFILVMTNNILFKMFFKNLFTCFFITWIFSHLLHCKQMKRLKFMLVVSLLLWIFVHVHAW